MRSVSNLLIYPLIQSHRRHAVLAYAHGLAVGFVSARRTIHQLEQSAGTRRNVRNRRRTKPLLRRDTRDDLIDLNRSQPGVERVTFGIGGLEPLVPFVAEIAEA